MEENNNYNTESKVNIENIASNNMNMNTKYDSSLVSTNYQKSILITISLPKNQNENNNFKRHYKLQFSNRDIFNSLINKCMNTESKELISTFKVEIKYNNYFYSNHSIYLSNISSYICDTELNKDYIFLCFDSILNTYNELYLLKKLLINKEYWFFNSLKFDCFNSIEDNFVYLLIEGLYKFTNLKGISLTHLSCLSEKKFNLLLVNLIKLSDMQNEYFIKNGCNLNPDEVVYSKFTYLNLSHNSFSYDTAGDSLSRLLKSVKYLEILELSNISNISKHGLNWLFKGLETNKTIVKLNLSKFSSLKDCSSINKLVDIIFKMTSLKDLEYRNNYLTLYYINKLSEREFRSLDFSNCSIIDNTSNNVFINNAFIYYNLKKLKQLKLNDIIYTKDFNTLVDEDFICNEFHNYLENTLINSDTLKNNYDKSKKNKDCYSYELNSQLEVLNLTSFFYINFYTRNLLNINILRYKNTIISKLDNIIENISFTILNKDTSSKIKYYITKVNIKYSNNKRSTSKSNINIKEIDQMGREEDTYTNADIKYYFNTYNKIVLCEFIRILSFPCLKELYLSKFYFSDDSIILVSEMLIELIFLEKLTLKDCFDFLNIDYVGPSDNVVSHRYIDTKINNVSNNIIYLASALARLERLKYVSINFLKFSVNIYNMNILLSIKDQLIINDILVDFRFD